MGDGRHDLKPRRDAAEPLRGAEAARLLDAAFPARGRVLLAVSGGADSTALLVLAAEWAARREGPRLSVATVDHRLRPEAAQEIEAVRRLCADLGLGHARLDAVLSAGKSSRIEETARERRYAALVAHARAVGADAISTAHTLDDQAETVLMRLAAGSGPAGLAAMAVETVRDGIAHLRPFLGVPKARLVASLEARMRRYADDAMNADPRFARARLRAGRAALDREGLTAERLARLAFRMARVNAALDEATAAAAAQHLSRSGDAWTIAPGAAALPDEIKLRLLARAVEQAGGGRARLDRLERLADEIVTRPSGAATLAGARIAWRPDGRISLSLAPPRRRDGAKSGAQL